MTGPAAVQVHGPAQLIELVPYLLGFHPVESVVLVGLCEHRVNVTARVDIAAGETATAHTLTAVRRTADSALLIVYSDKPLPQWLTQPPADLVDALHVTAGRWFSLLCHDPGCCPPEGHALPGTPSVPAVTAVSLGLAPTRSRADLVASLAPRSVTPDAADRAAELTPIPARDAAWIELDRFMGDEGALRALAAYYLETAQHCPQDATAAAPWFLYAWAQWRLGDGARAAIALDNLAAADPDYTAAALLCAALRIGTDPRSAPALTRPPLDPDTPPSAPAGPDPLSVAVAAALDQAGLPWTCDQDGYTVAGCSVGLNHATGRPEVWQVEPEGDVDRVAEALADVHVAPRGSAS